MALSLTAPGTAEPQALLDVNTTPLIDVMLVLLVMLIITVPVPLHSIALSLPKANQSAAPPPVLHQIGIDFDGTLTWDGETLTGPAALAARMQAIGTQTASDQPVLQIKADKLADYGAVAAVMAAAQRAGVKTVGLAGNERFSR